MFFLTHQHGFNVGRRRVSFVGSSTSTTEFISLSFPTGTAPGDIAIVGAKAAGGSASTGTPNYLRSPPTIGGGGGAAFTLIGTYGGIANVLESVLAYKILTSADIASDVSFSVGTTPDNIDAIMGVCRIHNGVMGTPTSATQSIVATNPGAGTITPSTAVGIGVATYSAAATTVSPRRVTVTTFSIELNSSARHYMHLFFRQGLPAFTCDMDDEGTGNARRTAWIPVNYT